MKDGIMVSVICVAYNHERYIRECMESILNQKIDFDMELIVHDDASKDRTADIIREFESGYPDIVKPIYQKENQFFRKSISAFIFPKVKGKYIAFCDGDDYWTDTGKLQKQVDFLECHSEYSMCMHNAVRFNDDTGEEKLLDTFPEDGTYSQEQQILAGLGSDFPAWSSVMARAEPLKDIPEFFLKPKALDYSLRQYYASLGKVHYFSKPMSAYRVSAPQSYMQRTTASQEFYNQYTLDMIVFFENLDRYTEGKFHSILERKILSDYFGFCLSSEREEGLKKALEHGLDTKKTREIYDCLSEDYLDERIRTLCQKTSGLFIYGVSRLAPICKKQLENAEIAFEGFVVSDNQMKADVLENKKVFYLSEVIQTYKIPGFVLAVQPVNANAIEEVLKEHGVKNYCIPYTIKDR